MKRLFLTIGLVAAGSLAYGQGTVQFSNSSLYRFSTASTVDGTTAQAGTVATVPTTSGLMEYGVFYGIGESTSFTLLTSQYGVNSTTGNGLIANPTDGKSSMGTIPIPGTNPGDTNVFLVADAWAAKFGTDYAAAHAAFTAGDTTSFWGTSGNPVNIGALGPTTGPGVPIWTFSTGTGPAFMKVFTILQPVPEPASFALAGLGAATLLIFRRRK